MLHHAGVSFVIALIAAMLGVGAAGQSVKIGWFFVLLSFVFLVVAVVGGRGLSATG